MKLSIVRDLLDSKFTKGKLYIDGTYFCHTIEDTDRKLETTGCSAKIQDVTCIPRGTYNVVTDYSNHFQKDMIHILNVNCFQGVRIHSGNTSADTEGCIIVGYDDSTPTKDWIGTSRPAANDLYMKVKGAIAAGHKIELDIS
jgi:hypothetical protein